MARSPLLAWWLPVLCVAIAVLLPAASAAPMTAAEPATWPDHGPYRKVGGDKEGLSNVKLPVPLVAAVQRSFVRDDPSQWVIFDAFHDFAGHGWRILQVYGEYGYATLLQAQGAWTILSAPASLPVLNEVLDPLTPTDLPRRDKLESYLWHVVLLQRYGQGTFLDGEFRYADVDTSRYKLWLRGTETRRQALRALCHDPVLIRTGDRVTVSLNVMNNLGAVEAWTFHLRLGPTVRLEGTDVRRVRRDHAFFYPLI